MIQTQGVGDLSRIYLTANRDDFDFNLAFIPKTFIRGPKEPFESAYMNDLYKVDYDMAVGGYPWRRRRRSLRRRYSDGGEDAQAKRGSCALPITLKLLRIGVGDCPQSGSGPGHRPASTRG
jgi:hypothetical protein